eukprot:3538221-Pleurochrysis_carterae.AAC.1
MADERPSVHAAGATETLLATGLRIKQVEHACHALVLRLAGPAALARVAGLVRAVHLPNTPSQSGPLASHHSSMHHTTLEEPRASPLESFRSCSDRAKLERHSRRLYFDPFESCFYPRSSNVKIETPR